MLDWDPRELPVKAEALEVSCVNEPGVAFGATSPLFPLREARVRWSAMLSG